ncbi:MAG: SAM-dependent methyltransferase [Myxococcaceae bacterium]|nr:SAM-dependent methyltransferase [Myxococcaceae bacterium]
MADAPALAPDNTAVRVALWRALHVQVDAPPHVLEDELGLRLAAPAESWQNRPDMHSSQTRRSRASIVARARYIEDLVADRVKQGVSQYVLLGAGLDTFAQRRPELASQLRVFEVDQPDTQAWKRSRLRELGFALPEYLHLVPVDFEAKESWLEQLVTVGFEPRRPAVVASTGVSMYLTREAVTATLRQGAALSSGSTFVMSFMLPLDLVEVEERPAIAAAERGARAGGTPFISFFTPPEILALGREAGFENVKHVNAAELAAAYFGGRSDGLRPSSSEELLIATA